MKTTFQEQWTILKSETYIPMVIDAFMTDRRSSNSRPGTLYFYQTKLALLQQFCDLQVVKDIGMIDPSFLRQLMTWLESTGHNPGGRHAVFRATRALLYWWNTEVEPDNWHNPFLKVKAPKVDLSPLDPVTVETIKKLLTVSRVRDQAIFLLLVDTGIRVSELCNLNVDDISLLSGDVLIRESKSREPRTVYIGRRTKHAIRSYLKTRQDDNESLFIDEDEGDRLQYSGIRDMFARRERAARISHVTPHMFRRYFAVTMLRAGVDVYTLQKLMGHADLQVLQRYVKLVGTDLKLAHRKASPADNL